MPNHETEQPFSSLVEVMDHSSLLKREFWNGIQIYGSEEMNRILEIEEEVRSGGRLNQLTKTYSDLGAKRVLSDTGGLFGLVGYTPERPGFPKEKSNQERVQEKTRSTARQLVGETLPQVTLALINTCQDHGVPLTNVGQILPLFGPIEPDNFIGGLKYKILPKEQVGELLGKTWGEIAEILVLQAAAREQDDWRCYLTAIDEAKAIAQAVTEVANQSRDLPHFMQGALGILAKRIEENKAGLSPLIESSLPHRLEETQKILSLLAMGTRGSLTSSEKGVIAGEDERIYVCLSNLASFDSLRALIEALAGKTAEKTIYYVDPHHIDELRLRWAEYSLRFSRDPLHLTTIRAREEKPRPKWPAIVTEPLKGQALARKVRGRLSAMNVNERTFTTLTAAMKKRLLLYGQAVESTQEAPVFLREFLRYHRYIIVFLSNVAGHSLDSAQAMEKFQKFIEGEATLEQARAGILRKHLVKMAGLFGPQRFSPGDQRESMLEDFHDTLIELANSLEEIARQIT